VQQLSLASLAERRDKFFALCFGERSACEGVFI